MKALFALAIGGTRTRDPRLGKPMLYLLSYYRSCLVDLARGVLYLRKKERYAIPLREG